MNYIKVRDLNPGQIFSHPVYIDEDTIFIPAGVPVREKDLERLHAWKVTQLESEGHTVADYDGDGQSETFSEDWWVSADEDMLTFYNSAIERVEDVFVRIRNQEKVSEKEIEDIVSDIIRTVEEQRVEAVRLVLSDITHKNSMAKSAVNSVLLVVTVAFFLNRPRHKLFQLCSGALLHDAGMLRIPRHLAELQRELDPDEQKTLKTHPVYSYRIAAKELRLSEEVAQIVLQHHERWDGEGYPQGLKAAQIVFESRVVSVADAFEAMVSERPWRNSMVGYEAMKLILSDNQRRFDPEIVKIFIQAMGLYPVGSFVMLSDGSTGQVISSKEDAPLRPKVMILINKSGRQHKAGAGPVIDLLENRKLFISRALDAKSVKEHPVSGSEQ